MLLTHSLEDFDQMLRKHNRKLSQIWDSIKQLLQIEDHGDLFRRASDEDCLYYILTNVSFSTKPYVCMYVHFYPYYKH